MGITKIKPRKTKAGVKAKEASGVCCMLVLNLLNDFDQQAEVNLSTGGNHTFRVGRGVPLDGGGVYAVRYKFYSRNFCDDECVGTILHARFLGTKAGFTEMMLANANDDEPS